MHRADARTQRFCFQILPRFIEFAIMIITRPFISVLTIFSLAACSAGGPTVVQPVSPSTQVVQVYETRGDQSRLLARQADLTATTTTATGTIISIDPSVTYQSFDGAGASFTDASSYLIQHKMSAAQRNALMEDLFSPSGLNLSLMRLTIGASDFSQSHYSYDDMPAGQTDPSLAHFSIASAKVDVIPTAKAALDLNPKLKIMASPWSAPGWMKTSDSLITGSLKPAAYPYFADYLVTYIQAMKAEGVPIFAITLQNEPGFEPSNYPGMRVDPADRAVFIGQYLGPKMKASGLGTKLFDYDHNWDAPASPLTVLGDATANPYVDGVAWHCYGGDVSAQGTVHDAYPTKDVYFTECSGGQWAPEFSGTFTWMMKNLIIGSANNWGKGVLLWNLALDENYGPHLGGCGDCRGVVTINSTTGEVTKNVEYYALGHISKFVRSGAVRISSTSVNGLSTVAFKNSDDGSVVLIVLNESASAQGFAIQKGDYSASYSLPSGAATTFVWQ